MIVTLSFCLYLLTLIASIHLTLVYWKDEGSREFVHAILPLNRLRIIFRRFRQTQ
jgi:hypothetical protein